ncbi:MAG: EAL domain-containing protein [Alphaproteobacteria bacterium]|nr:EAL domain-containing protein [Alphaproteobacteria bacterium]
MSMRSSGTLDAKRLTPRVLLVEHDEDDYAVTSEFLADIYGDNLRLSWAKTWKDGLAELRSNSHDVALIGYRLGVRTGLELIVKAASLRNCDAAMILMTGQDDSEIDLQAMEAGAMDYLVKGSLSKDQLARSIRYSIKQKRVQSRLSRLAEYDSLTSLANRALFDRLLADAVAQCQRTDKPFALLLVDIDEFKAVNDAYGHAVGDRVLIQSARRLTRCVRETDFVARLSGDEFAVVATNMESDAGATAIARKIIREMSAPIRTGDDEVTVACSIGIDTMTSGQHDQEQLLKNADLALHQAKKAGRLSFRFYDDALDARERERKALEVELRAAIVEQRFQLYYQPKIRAADHHCIGCEALLRLQRPGQAPSLPADLIDIAETTGLIAELGDWIVRDVCRQIAAWNADGFRPSSVAINISPIQFRKGDLVALVRSATEEFGIDPAVLEFEITEGLVIENAEHVAEALEALRTLGVKVSIDDFGTGYSSLAYLTKFPVDKLKVDRFFVTGIPGNRTHEMIASTVVHLARNLNIDVVVEGVETEAQLLFFDTLSCDELQGYYFSPPIPADDFVQWVSDHEPGPSRTLAVGS